MRIVHLLEYTIQREKETTYRWKYTAPNVPSNGELPENTENCIMLTFRHPICS